jgi:uncharacterized protein (DUF433 family)
VIALEFLERKANGDVVIAGTGVRVYTIQSLHEVGETPEYIAEQRDLPLGTVSEALAYATEHPDEIDAVRRVDDAAALQALSDFPEPLRQEARRVRQADEAVLRETIDHASGGRSSETRRSTSAE